MVGLLLVGCDDAKVDSHLDKAKDSAEQMKDAAEKKADQLTDDA
ncbi:E3 ubiquitin--protein ligase, partial [Escherichia coli]|nr:E3 ubiquitin--protein ligase [Escherichia coli]